MTTETPKASPDPLARRVGQSFDEAAVIAPEDARSGMFARPDAA